MKMCDTTTMTATMCQLVSTGPAVNRAEPADFHCPPPSTPHLPGNLFSARLALGSPRSVTFALPQKPVPDRTKYFPLFRFATVVSAQCSSDTDSPRSSLCLTVSLLLARGCCCCDTPRTSLDLSAAACDASNHGHGGAQRQDQEDVQLEQ